METVLSLGMVHENYKTDVISRIKHKSVVKENGCIEYLDGKSKHKYGLISITVNGRTKNIPAHRAHYMAVNELWDLPTTTQVRHTCDNPPCVNIEHLIPGTSKDNAQDVIERQRRAKKIQLHTRTLIHSNEKISAIRNEVGKIKHLAEKYGVSPGYVSKIKNMQAKKLVK